jgi:hypothetical protein
MNFKRLINNKNLVILLFLILGVLFLNNFFTIREGKDITPEEADGLTKDIESTVKQKMEAAGVPYDSPDRTDLLQSLTTIMETEIARSTQSANASAAAAQKTSSAENTVAPIIIDNSFFIGNSFSDVFCNKYTGAQLENKCADLTEDNCNITDCCVFVNGVKCMAGSATGPKNTGSFKADTDYYLYKYQCYGNCDARREQMEKKVKPKILDCRDELKIVSTSCFNQHVTELKCDGFIIPPNFSGASQSGMVIANNKIDFSRLKDLTWGMIKRLITVQVMAKPADCSKPNYIADSFNIKN